MMYSLLFHPNPPAAPPILRLASYPHNYLRVLRSEKLAGSSDDLLDAAIRRGFEGLPACVQTIRSSNAEDRPKHTISCSLVIRAVSTSVKLDLTSRSCVLGEANSEKL